MLKEIVTSDDEIMDLRGRRITKITGNEIITPISSIKEIVISQIVAGCKVELADGKALTMNNLVQIYKDIVVEYGGKDGRADSAIRIDLARVIQKRICDKMDGVQLQNPYLHKQSQRLVTSNLTAFAQKYAEDFLSGSDNETIYSQRLPRF